MPNAFEILSYINMTSNLETVYFRKMKEYSMLLDEFMMATDTVSKEELGNVIVELSRQNNEIVFDHNNISTNTFNSFVEIYKKDRNNFTHKIQLDDIPYRNKIIEYINKAFYCDGIALKATIDNLELYISQGFEVYNEYLILRVEAIHKNFIRDIDFNDFEEQLFFVYEEQIIHTSTGQKTFVDLVVNLLSRIKPNSLILIDEPENTLHPNLEIDFLKILKTVLEEFDSFAIIATHSSVIVRDVPSEYTKIIKIDNEGQPVIIPPSIHTFGGDIGKITNYVFDDIFIKQKPFEEWLELQYQEYNNFEDFEDVYADILNYNMLSKAKRIWKNKCLF